MYGDDVRHIDWNVTARLQTPYVREYNEEREVAAWFLLDLSPSVDFGSSRIARSSAVSTRVRRRARAHPHAPRQPRRRALLRRPRGHGDPARAAGGARCCISCTAWPTGRSARKRGRDRPARAPAHRLHDGAAALADVRRLRFHQRARVGRAARASRAAARRRRRAPLRSARNGTARPRAARRQDAETGEQLFVDTHDRGFRRRFAAAAKARETELRARVRDAPASTRSSSSTDDDLVDAILRFADLRKRRSQLATGGGCRSTSGCTHDLAVARMTARGSAAVAAAGCCSSLCYCLLLRRKQKSCAALREPRR